MKLKTVKYQKCFNLGNFENEVIGVEIEVESGETGSIVLEAAKRFVISKGDPLKDYKETKQHYQTILRNKDTYTYKVVQEAIEWLDNDEKNMDDGDLPF